MLDSIATRYDPGKLGGRRIALNLVMPERGESAGIEAGATTLIGRMTPLANPDVTITAPRRAVLGLLFLKLPLAQLEAMGVKVTGDRGAVEALQGALDPLPGGFNIAEP